MSVASEWIEYTRNDIDMARRALAPNPLPGAAAFHVQQAAEKAAKALIYARGERAARTHDLQQLSLALPDGSQRDEVAALDRVTGWAVVGRYPLGDEELPTEEVVREWLAKVATFVKQAQ